MSVEYGRCLCGARDCPSCGPAQGVHCCQSEDGAAPAWEGACEVCDREWVRCAECGENGVVDDGIVYCGKPEKPYCEWDCEPERASA